MTSEYIYLFNTITNAIQQLEALRLELMLAQQKAETLFLERTD